jgi:dTDP-4-dehydrorhamnose reductase
MKILVTGAAGMLGQDLLSVLGAVHEVRGVDLAQVDVTDSAAVLELIEQAVPEMVVHAAAYTDVERAEKEPDRAMQVNAQGAANVAEACAVVGARMLMIGTDFVFDGAADRPYREIDPVNPVNAYGRSKLEGERLARGMLPSLTVLRTAWLYGAHGENFLTKILKAAGGKKSITVVTDEMGSPTYTVDLAAVIGRMIARDCMGQLYHGAGVGSCSRYQLARELFTVLGINDCELIPGKARDFASPVKRPANSALACERLVEEGVEPPRLWREALREFAIEHLKPLVEKEPGESE